MYIIGFVSRTQFNYAYGEGQENVGNNVPLVSDTRSYTVFTVLRGKQIVLVCKRKKDYKLIICN